MTKDPAGIYNWQRLDAHVTTSGRLTADDLPQLAKIGVRHVIDLTPAGHDLTLDKEKQLLARLSIQHSLIEVPFNKPTDELYQQFVATFHKAARPVHVHCIYNFRSSAFMYRYNLESGMSLDEARSLMLRHWSPETSDHPSAAPWKEFIEQTNAHRKVAPMFMPQTMHIA